MVFSEPVTDFTTGEVTLSGTAPGTLVGTVTNPSGDQMTYNVAVSGMTGTGTVVATIAAGKAHDAAGNANVASTSTINTVTYNVTAPTVTINVAAGQANPTNASPINFTVVFSKVVTGFATGKVTLSGTAVPTTATVTNPSGDGKTYNVAVSGMTGNGTVIASLAAGVAHDAAGNASVASTSTSNSVTYNTTAPSVTINQAAAQPDPTNATPINFTVVFSEAVTGFVTGNVTLGGTAPGTLVATVTGAGTTYNVAVGGMTGNGAVTASLAAGVAHDAAGNLSTASTSTDNTVTYDIIAPAVTLNVAAGQPSLTNLSPINFAVVFTKPVVDFTGSKVTLSGTAGATTALVTNPSGDGKTFNVAVSGMTGSGTVTAALAAGKVHDAAGNGNQAATSTANTVTYDITAPTVTINVAATQVNPTTTLPINFSVVFSKPVSNFTASGIVISGTAPGIPQLTVTGSGTTYTVSVSGLVDSGSVSATVNAGAASDAAGNPCVALDLHEQHSPVQRAADNLYNHRPGCRHLPRQQRHSDSMDVQLCAAGRRHQPLLRHGPDLVDHHRALDRSQPGAGRQRHQQLQLEYGRDGHGNLLRRRLSVVERHALVLPLHSGDCAPSSALPDLRHHRPHVGNVQRGTDHSDNDDGRQCAGRQLDQPELRPRHHLVERQRALDRSQPGSRNQRHHYLQLEHDRSPAGHVLYGRIPLGQQPAHLLPCDDVDYVAIAPAANLHDYVANLRIVRGRAERHGPVDGH